MSQVSGVDRGADSRCSLSMMDRRLGLSLITLAATIGGAGMMMNCLETDFASNLCCGELAMAV